MYIWVRAKGWDDICEYVKGWKTYNLLTLNNDQKIESTCTILTTILIFSLCVSCLQIFLMGQLLLFSPSTILWSESINLFLMDWYSIFSHKQKYLELATRVPRWWKIENESTASFFSYRKKSRCIREAISEVMSLSSQIISSLGWDILLHSSNLDKSAAKYCKQWVPVITPGITWRRCSFPLGKHPPVLH